MLFLQKGYEATGVAEILREADVNSGSLYYFFKSKEELLLAVLDWYVANLYPEVIDPATAQTNDPIERVFVVLDGYRQYLTITECRQGCPIGNLALEMSERSETVRAKVALNFENWRKAVRQFLYDAGDRLPSDLDRDALATFILSVMEGGVMLSRAHRSLVPFESSITMLRDYVERLVALGTKSGPPGSA
jgi:AcrR family transcriptional regulator